MNGAHLNGEYYSNPENFVKTWGIIWEKWQGYNISLSAVSMMITSQKGNESAKCKRARFSVLFKGLLVTGGGTKGTEIYNPVTKTSCPLPALPEVRSLHSQDGPLLCGGNENTHTRPLKNCFLFNSGTYTTGLHYT